MKRTLKLSLNKGDFKQIGEMLGNYKSSLPSRTETFVKNLMDAGIAVAKQNVKGEYAPYIVFEKHTATNGGIVGGALVATDGKKLVREWYADKNLTIKRWYEVSPLLLSEFGSGWLSVVMDNVAGVGQGTMPNSYGHATDDDGWYWYDDNGNKHHSIGEAPTFPMHKALIEMQAEINRIAQDTFGKWQDI